VYNHKWEIKFGKNELMLSIPENIDELLGQKEIVASQKGYSGSIPGYIIGSRNKFLRK
jgi:hypothetical protein